MAINTGLKKSNGVDLGNNLFAGNGSSSGNQTFKILQSNGIDLGKGWYNKSYCSAAYGNVGFKNAAGVDVGTLLGKYGTLNCDCDCNCECDSDSDGGCFISGKLLTNYGLIEVSQLKIGMLIWGSDEKFHKIVGIAKSSLGNRHGFRCFGGGLVTEEHIVYQGKTAYSANKKLSLKENSNLVYDLEANVKGLYDIPINVQQFSSGGLITLPEKTLTYSPICLEPCIGYLNNDKVAIAGCLHKNLLP